MATQPPSLFAADQPKKKRSLFDPPTQQQPGLLGQVAQNVNTPLTFDKAPQVRPTDPVQAQAKPLEFTTPQPVQAQAQAMQQLPTSYQGRRVGPSQTFTAPGATFANEGGQLEEATYQRGLNRIDPYFEQQRQGLAQRLANQGLPIGSEAYNEALNRFDRSRSDALENLALSSVGAGRAEQGRLFGQALAGRQFDAGEAGRGFRERLAAEGQYAGQRNQALRNMLASQSQQFGQQHALDQFGAGQQQQAFQNLLAGQGQQFGQQFGLDQFGAQQQGQTFNQDMARRGQSIREQMMMRQQPIQDLGTLLGMAGQVQAPQFQPVQQMGPMAPNYGQYAQSNYMAQMQRPNPWLQGAFGIGQAGLGLLRP